MGSSLTGGGGDFAREESKSMKLVDVDSLVANEQYVLHLKCVVSAMFSGWKEAQERCSDAYRQLSSHQDVINVFSRLLEIQGRPKKPEDQTVKKTKKPSESAVTLPELRNVKEKPTCAQHPGKNCWCYIWGLQDKHPGQHVPVDLDVLLLIDVGIYQALFGLNLSPNTETKVWKPGGGQENTEGKVTPESTGSRYGLEMSERGTRNPHMPQHNPNVTSKPENLWKFNYAGDVRAAEDILLTFEGFSVTMSWRVLNGYFKSQKGFELSLELCVDRGKCQPCAGKIRVQAGYEHYLVCIYLQARVGEPMLGTLQTRSGFHKGDYAQGNNKEYLVSGDFVE
ncbi:hypothetical protein C8R46DRAFT_1031021 [Mycena filopes]|nr:hypothetical protein C8R46DRAFT_1031021 [Mycena filopes]